MPQSKIDQVKEILIYAPLGAFRFLKRNLPTYISAFASLGKVEQQRPAPTPEIELNKEDIVPPDRKQKARSTVSNMTSDISKAKNLLYSGVGALDFLNRSAPLVKGLVNESGKQSVEKRSQAIGDKVSSKVTSLTPKILSKSEETNDIEDPRDEPANTMEGLIRGTGKLGIKAAASLFELSLGAVSQIESTLRRCDEKLNGTPTNKNGEND